MPSLSSSNSLVTSKNRMPDTLIDEHFASGTGGFSGSGADISNVSDSIRVLNTQTDGYATQSFTTLASTKYYYSIKLAGSQAGSGDKTIMIGTSGGDDSLVDVTQNTSGVTSSGSFTTGGSTTTIHLGLKVQTDAKYARWDDILIETWDTD